MEHYYSEKQESALDLKKISSFLRGRKLEFYTGGGVFSPKKIDRGTEILINSMVLDEGWEILDLGCGYGPVGIAAFKSLSSCKVSMVDTNKRSVKLAGMNLKLNKAEAEVKQGSLYEPFEIKKFDTIIVNPPQSAGKAVCIQMIKGAATHLKKGGLLQLVARHNKGGRHLSEIMNETFGNIREIIKKSGYRVYVAELK